MLIFEDIHNIFSWVDLLLLQRYFLVLHLCSFQILVNDFDAFLFGRKHVFLVKDQEGMVIAIVAKASSFGNNDSDDTNFLYIL